MAGRSMMMVMMIMTKNDADYLPAFLVSATSCLHISVEESELQSWRFEYKVIKVKVKVKVS